MELQTTKKEVVSLRLTPDIQKQIRQLAKAKRRSFSQLVELILEAYLVEHQGDARDLTVFDERIHEPGGVPLREEGKTDALLAAAFPTGVQHEVWSPYDEYDAAAQLQALLAQPRL